MAVALDVSGLAAPMARGARVRYKRVVGGFASVGADGAHRAAATAPASTRTSPPSPSPASINSAASGR